MLRVYIWNPIATATDPAAWGDMVLDNIDRLLPSAPPHLPHLRVLPDVYGDDVRPRWGHAAMGFRNVVVGGTPIVAYRALWPRDARHWPLIDPEPGVINTSLDYDRELEGGEPDIVFAVPSTWPVDEPAVWAQWEHWRAAPPGYAAYGFNCCASVARSLRLNIDIAGLNPVAQALVQSAEPFAPHALYQWLVNLEATI